MLFPISDDDRHLMHPAWVTIGLVVMNIAVFFLQLANPEMIYAWSAVPFEIINGVDLIEPTAIDAGSQSVVIPQLPGPTPIHLTLLSSMFMHGGWMHLGGNLLYLWIFGDNVEHRFGSLPFLGFYLLSGLAASLAQIMMGPDSVIPTLGASGAISGVMGAYMVLFPRNRVNAVFFFRIISVPAVVVLGFWIVTQVISGSSSISEIGKSGGVAYAAHIGGFIAGVLAGIFCRAMLRKEPDSVFRDIYNKQRNVKKYW
ncbi:rhomboid family intramembrane serine protease [Haloferula sp.]|uniref:rhomboid family intramembrane serine protease n=1 Tax=Haloferula sp. TaxID=2497595 RepID=UPI00329E41CD